MRTAELGVYYQAAFTFAGILFWTKNGHVGQVEAGALFDPGAGVPQQGDDRAVPDAAAVSGPLHRGFLPLGERVGPPGRAIRVRGTAIRIAAACS